MQFHELAQRIAQPPDGDWVGLQTAPVQGMLLGVCASLFASLHHLNELADSDLAAWVPNGIYHEFELAISDSADSFWWRTENLSVWSAGYFINKGQANVGAAFDVLLTEWIWRKENEPRPQYVKSLAKAHARRSFVYIMKRLINKNIPAGGDLFEQIIQKFEKEKLHYTTNAKCAVLSQTQDLQRQECWPSPIDLYKDGLKFDEAGCLAICYGRNNAFKHRISGYREERAGLQHSVDWAITARAGVLVNRLWTCMVKDNSAD